MLLPVKLFLGNFSIIGILISSLSCFLIRGFMYHTKPLLRGFVWFLVLSILLLFQSRSAVIGFLFGLAFLHWTFIGQLWKSNRNKLAIVCSGLLLFVLLLYAKKDSSSGRLLIYNIATKIFSDNYLWGVGWGNYKAQHNLYQSAHFAISDIDSANAILADNTFYAFNDLWQLLIEIGTIRFVRALSVAALLIYFLLKNFIVRQGGKHIFQGAVAGLISIFAASLFSYPFQIFATTALAVLCVVLILLSIQPKTASPAFTNPVLRALQAASVLGVVFIFFQAVQDYHIHQHSKEAFELSQSGFKKEAAFVYAQLEKDYPGEFNFLYPYAQLLYYQNRLMEAQIVVAKAKRLFTDNDLYKLSGTIEYELGNYKQAEKDFKTALYMVPNRMRSRFELFNFYLNRKDTTQAKQWGNSILTMPVKIPSETTQNIQKQVQAMMVSL